jgi:uncharacterized protein (UPF0335 family)
MAEGTVAADELRLLIERIERLEEEKKAIGDDVKDVYAEGKARGYDTKTMRVIIRLRKMEKHAREEAEAMLETYKEALGMSSFESTPLGRTAATGEDLSVEQLAEKLQEMGATVSIQGSQRILSMPIGEKRKAA